jgi:hypothetical protein
MFCQFHSDSQGYIVPEFHTDSQGYIVPYKGHIKSKLLPLCQMIITLQFRKINYNRLPVGFVYVAYISILWHHEKEVRQWTFHAMSRHSLITIVWWYNILYRTPLTEKFLFSLSKANLYNVRYYSAKKKWHSFRKLKRRKNIPIIKAFI